MCPFTFYTKMKQDHQLARKNTTALPATCRKLLNELQNNYLQKQDFLHWVCRFLPCRMCFLPSLPVPLTAHASSWAQVPLPLLTLALLPLPFTLLYETYFLPNHALVLMIVYFLKRFPFSKEFCGHPVFLLLDH